MSDSDEYESAEYYPTKPKPPVIKPKPVAAAERPPVSPSASSPKAPRKPIPYSKPVVGPNQHLKSSPKSQRRSEYSGPSMPPQSPSYSFSFLDPSSQSPCVLKKIRRAGSISDKANMEHG